MTLRKTTEQVFIESLPKNVLEDCILPLSGSKSFFCYCESVIYFICIRKWQVFTDFKPLLGEVISKESD
jgi:hypothetical protein